MLERTLHTDNCWVTLTYSDDHLPKGGSLAPRDTQLWLKKFRKRIRPFAIRYYLVGEYGDQDGRPHYHVILFGYPNCSFGRSRYSEGRESCCEVCDTVRDTWGQGHVLVASLDQTTARYTLGYTLKKMTRDDDPRLGGRHPEFARMSLRPGIGREALWEVASELLRYDLHEKYVDVPVSLGHGRVQLPLGRYLRSELREFVGKERNAPQAAVDQYQKEMHNLRIAARNDKEDPSLRSHIVKANTQGVLNMESRMRIFKERKKL